MLALTTAASRMLTRRAGVQNPDHLHLQRSLEPEAALAAEPLPRAAIPPADQAADSQPHAANRAPGVAEGERNRHGGAHRELQQRHPARAEHATGGFARRPGTSVGAHLQRAQMRRLNSDTLQFDDVKSTATKDLELGAFNASDKCVARTTSACAFVLTHRAGSCRPMRA